MRLLSRFIILLTTVFLCSTVVSADSFDDLQDIDRIWDGQKSITNKEFDQVIDALESKTKQKEEKKAKKKVKKISGGGTALHLELSPDKSIQELKSIKESTEDVPSTPVYVRLFLEDNILEPGFYKVIVEKEQDGNYYSKFYQSDKYLGKYQITKTESDFDEENLNFVKIIGYNEQFVKLIYGSIDINAYAYIPYSMP